ncbi:peptidoglycan DD-metalloendopeptidase family protein [Thermosulfurimonas marina]|uniref:Peptidoglycan DD-metalloendopeptidase family protein n=1 Tax=Thermosulfurimonas marina TaxID=2047767 RepID=A0A6H1WQ96_9BACT|nr:peptidoglycan DD-metalloendopeptidase family protein [Thermosulfurimonas marina]QJA05334.1 peptidoglycan DD-metalloendopeptidase family protein [Thermosulfurimonas marina]
MGAKAYPFAYGLYPFGDRRYGILLRLFILACGAALLFLSPARAGSLSLEKKIQEKRLLLERATVKEKSILEELQDLAREISRYSREIKNLEGQIRELKKEIEALSQTISHLEEKKKRLKARLSQEMALLATLSRTTWMNLLFEPREINEFLRREDYLYLIIQNESEKLKTLRQTMEDIAFLRAEKEKKIQEYRERQEDLRKKVAELRLLKKEKETLLEEVRRNKRLYREMLSLLEAAKEEMETLAREMAETRRQLQALKKEKRREPKEGLPHLRPLFEVKGLLVAPVKGKLLRFFGLDRDPFTGKYAFSPGIYIGAPPGTPVVAPFLARASRLRWVEGQGQVLVLDHGYGFVSMLGGLDQVNVALGEYVRTGQPLGTVADSPFGPSGVYYELRRGNRPLNPLEWLDLKTLRLVR